jgi:hypothetical protein
MKIITNLYGKIAGIAEPGITFGWAARLRIGS